MSKEIKQRNQEKNCSPTSVPFYKFQVFQAIFFQKFLVFKLDPSKN